MKISSVGNHNNFDVRNGIQPLTITPINKAKTLEYTISVTTVRISEIILKNYHTFNLQSLRKLLTECKIHLRPTELLIYFVVL
jgi:hypothetical protein